MKRNRWIYISCAVMAATIGAGTAAADEPLPKAETIMDRFVEVTGGKAAYEKRTSIIETSAMELVGKGVSGTATHWGDTSNNSYESGEIQGVGKVDDGVYNGVAWENSAIMGPRVKSGEERADAIRDSMFNGTLYWRKLYPKVETAGIEKVGDEDCYKVVATPTDGKPVTMYFSEKSGLMLKETRTLVSPMGEIPAETLLEDYKPFDGVLEPTKREQSLMGQQMVVTVTDIKVNAEIPKDRFQPPPEIQKLLQKAAAPAPPAADKK
jgi:hypothetical protein